MYQNRIKGVSSGYNDDIYESINESTYLETTDCNVNPSSTSIIAIDEYFNYIQSPQGINPTPKTSTLKIATEPEKDPIYAGSKSKDENPILNRPSARPPIARKPLYYNSFRTRQLSQELNEKFSQRSQIGTSQSELISENNPVDNFEDSFIDESFVDSDTISFEVLYDFDADNYCRKENLHNSGRIVVHMNLICIEVVKIKYL